MALSVSVTGVEEVAAHFGKLSESAHDKVYQKVMGLSIAVMNRAKQKVSGPVLNVKTGQLRANIFQDVEDGPGGIVGSIFEAQNVKYAAIHEFGGVIQHPGGTAYLIDPKTGVSKWISNKASIADQLPRTKAHTIHMPERSYLRSSLGEMKATIIEQLTDTVQKAMQEG